MTLNNAALKTPNSAATAMWLRTLAAVEVPVLFIPTTHEAKECP